MPALNFSSEALMAKLRLIRLGKIEINTTGNFDRIKTADNCTHFCIRIHHKLLLCTEWL